MSNVRDNMSHLLDTMYLRNRKQIDASVKRTNCFFRGTKYIHEILGEVKTNSNNTNNDLTNPLKLSFKTKLTSVLVDIISLKKCKASSETHICRWLVKLNLIYFEKKTIKMQTCKYLLKIRINQIQHKYTQVMKPTSND